MRDPSTWYLLRPSDRPDELAVVEVGQGGDDFVLGRVRRRRRRRRVGPGRRRVRAERRQGQQGLGLAAPEGLQNLVI